MTFPHDNLHTEPDTEDKILACSDCGDDFLWSAGEQAFFVAKQFPPPKRCAPCRRERQRAATGRAYMTTPKSVTVQRVDAVDAVGGGKCGARFAGARIITPPGRADIGRTVTAGTTS